MIDGEQRCLKGKGGEGQICSLGRLHVAFLR